ncbi:N-acyl-D-amino-acid deacylase [Actinomycetospora sp. NBRC 106375]|uniref:amidohydrolase family protein n=1 Tax=Actinomycetospora sp. NBRC 106375 TaxID=3032207 RepID=UPI0024A21CD2|nr:amidohydrolase family protein [Actinomycetospora sp. NBRC 106375]GLZ45591.1 N-acyl-D-amino-acid deacylase [Actinomycetospora sp. NBRC 106375]
MTDLLLRSAQVTGRDAPVDVAVDDGRITWIGDRFPGAARRVVDCAGDAVIPGLIEPHLHLDKALLDAEKPNPDGTLAGAVAVTGELKRGFTHESVRRRAGQVLEQAVTHGTTVIRAQPDVDTIVGLLGVEVMLELRATHADLVDLQVVAFPQEGILQRPGTEDLLVEALRAGADVVGGCSYMEPTVEECRAHVDRVFALAERFGVPVDIHADLADDTSDPRFALAGHIADRTRAHGMAGRVTVGHVTSLASLGADARKRAIADLADAGVAVVVLPATDMHLGGRSDDGNVRRGIAPVRDLLDAGVRTGLSSNNVRNGFTPFGNADVLDIALFLAQTAHLGRPDDLADLVRMATEDAAAIVGIGDRYGLHVGADADLVVLAAPTATDALLDRAHRRVVIKRGRIVATTEHTRRLHRAADGHR